MYMRVFFFFIKKAKDTNTEGWGDSSVKCWPCKDEDSSSNLRIHMKIQGIMALACTPSAGRWRQEQLWGIDEQPVWPNW